MLAFLYLLMAAMSLVLTAFTEADLMRSFWATLILAHLVEIHRCLKK